MLRLFGKSGKMESLVRRDIEALPCRWEIIRDERRCDLIWTVFNQGIWFRGQTGNISIEWNKRASHQLALVDWQLCTTGATLAAG